MYVGAAPTLRMPAPPSVTAPTIGQPPAPIGPKCPEPPATARNTGQEHLGRHPREEEDYAAIFKPHPHARSTGELSFAFRSGEQLIIDAGTHEQHALIRRDGKRIELSLTDESWFAPVEAGWLDDISAPSLEAPPKPVALRDDLADRVYGVRATRRESGSRRAVRADVRAVFKYGTRVAPLPPRVTRPRTSAAAVIVDGWPLLLLQARGPLDDDAFDWRELQLVLSADQCTAAAAIPAAIARAWRTELWLPITDAPEAAILLHQSVPSTATKPLGIAAAKYREPTRIDRAKDVIRPFGAGGPAVLVVRRFTGGTAHVEIAARAA
jgi:hypothetical protein